MTNASLTTIIVNFLPLWLLLLGIVLLLVSGPPVLRRKVLKPNQTKFKSLRATSPVLNTLVMISVVGKPFLENLRKNDWDTSFIAPQIEMPLVAVFIISLYALLAAVLFFFFRAIRNINVLSGERLRSPYSALFMLIPISNLIVIPYLSILPINEVGRSPDRSEHRNRAPRCSSEQHSGCSLPALLWGFQATTLHNRAPMIRWRCSC